MADDRLRTDQGPSQGAKDALVDELREVVGDDAVERADIDVDRAIDEPSGPAMPETRRNRLMLVLFVALGVMVAAIAALLLESWWVLVGLLVLHGILTTIVVTTTLRATASVEKPDPRLVARLENEGVADPDRALNNLVEQVADEEGDDAAESTARQRKATSPSSSPSRPVG